MSFIHLSDFFVYGKDLLHPTVPVSPYRYLEHLVELVLVRKYGMNNILEIGPGADPFLKYTSLDIFTSVAVLDYQRSVLERCIDTLSPDTPSQIETIQLDVESPGTIEQLGKTWDCIVANALLEHLKDDSRFVQRLRCILNKDGIFVGTTVLTPKLYNLWDHAVGHYRRYTVNDLQNMFSDYAQIQIIQTSLLQELSRPLFFHRVRHLQSSTLEENNQNFGEEQVAFGSPPFAPLYKLLQRCFPVYLLFDWLFKDIQGGIAIVIARK